LEPSQVTDTEVPVTPEEALDNVCRNVIRLAACSQRQLTKRTGIPLSVINKVYQQVEGTPMRSGLTLETVVRFANTLDVHPSELLKTPE
jgi:hypothetical protein